VAGRVAKIEVVKLVRAAACYRLSVMHVQRFFIEQTRPADRASPVLPGGEESLEVAFLVAEFSSPACSLVPVGSGPVVSSCQPPVRVA
jgi:hypothetical protein